MLTAEQCRQRDDKHTVMQLMLTMASLTRSEAAARLRGHGFIFVQGGQLQYSPSVYQPLSAISVGGKCCILDYQECLRLIRANFPRKRRKG
jgi:hypothetical protein